MPLLNAINHLTFLTADMSRLVAFYERVFDAPVTLDLEEEGLRHVFIEVGPDTVLLGRFFERTEPSAIR